MSTLKLRTLLSPFDIYGNNPHMSNCAVILFVKQLSLSKGADF